jgi:hypothetical protein
MSNQRDETIPVGFRVSKQQRLQTWALYFYGQKSIRPQHWQGGTNY